MNAYQNVLFNFVLQVINERKQERKEQENYVSESSQSNGIKSKSLYN